MFNLINSFVTHQALRLPRNFKRALAISLDSLICILATWIALSLRLEELVVLDTKYMFSTIISICVAIPIFISWGLYKEIFRYSSSEAIKVLAKAIATYAIIYFLIITIIKIEDIPRSIGLMQPMIIFILISISRKLVKIWLGKYLLRSIKDQNQKAVIIYGAGVEGRQLAVSLLYSKEFKLLCFVDEDKNFWGGKIDGYPITSPATIKRLIEKEKADELWLALPKLKHTERKKTINYLKKLPIYIRTLPSFSDLATGRIRLSDLRELDINELLGRNPIKPNINIIKKSIFQKIVMVTGAGGSIGSELSRQIFFQKPLFILLVESSEIALYNIHSELQFKQKSGYCPDVSIVPLLVNVQDKEKLAYVFESWKPHIVYHAAAYKHVPLVEHNIIAGISNNVIGTLICAKLAIKNKTKHFILISTDKAVRPTNVMGASKRLAEIGLQSLFSSLINPKTCLSMVRFGNVLGSSGSVVPLFRKQIEERKPVTLTHENVTRYFMTIPEASQLVIQASAMAKGGEVFVLDMGKPVLIADLARNMIEAAGLTVKEPSTPWGDIEIKITGMRPGEKLFEELLIGDNPQPTLHPRILQAHETFMESKDFNVLIKKIELAIKKNDIKKIKKLLIDNVEGYFPSTDIVAKV